MDNKSIDRLLEVYQQIAESDDIAYRLAALLTVDHYFSYSLKIANEVTSRQGKNRATVSIQTTKLMKYSLESDVDEILDSRLTQLFVDILNAYLEDKQQLPTNPQASAAVISRVKALIIMLLATNQYGIIPLLNIPTYVLSSVESVFSIMQRIKDEVLEFWIKYLIDSGNQEMAEIVKSVGNEFWGKDGVKANVIYDKWFGKIKDRIKDPVETYNKYLEFRLQYRRSTKNILPSKVYEVFNITPDSYDRARLNVYIEIQQMFPEDENAAAIKMLIFEKE